MNNLTTYINANIMLLSALSCVTLTDSELPAISNGQIYNNSIIPSINTSFSWENDTPYSVKNVAISTETDRKSTRLNSSHMPKSRMPSSA